MKTNKLQPPINEKALRECLRDSPAIDYAIIFGSALGTMHPNSDVDILIGGKLDFTERTHLTAKLELLLKKEVDIVLADEAPVKLALNAISKGKHLFVRNRDNLVRDYYRLFYMADNATGLRRIREERVKRRYEIG